MEKIKIASRSSRLALKQTEIVCESLKKFFEIEVVKVSTTGDKLLNAPLAEVGGKGLFVKELERSLLNGDAHIAVHSLKDMDCLLYTSPSPRDATLSRMPSSA